jgi:hypothetical protein|tara:strand:- start:3319 stop:3702 length:384 start_codon:yes stop_codon:yes gene_type:complete
MKYIRAKNYTDFADNWVKGIPCYYSAWKSLKCDGQTISLERQHSPNILIAEKKDGNLILYNHRKKDYASEILRNWRWYGSRISIKYATIGIPKSTCNMWLTNQLYDSLIRVATHLLHPYETIPEDEV